jgi:hypothetical protein
MNRIFLLMILAACLSGKMLQNKNLLMSHQQFLYMDPDSIQLLVQKLEEQPVNVTPKQLQKLKLFVFRAFVFAKLCDKQSFDHSQIRIPPKVLRHLMTKGVWKQMRFTPVKYPLTNLAEMRKFAKSFLMQSKYVFRTRDGLRVDKYKAEAACRTIKYMTSHPFHPFIAMIDHIGQVWVLKMMGAGELIRLIHDPVHVMCIEEASTCVFHRDRLELIVGVTGSILIYGFSDCLAHMDLKKRLHFFENSLTSSRVFSTRPPNFTAHQISLHPVSESFTAISDRGLAIVYDLDEKMNLICTRKYGYFELYKKGEIKPLCSCFSKDGKLVVAGYQDGTIMHAKVVNQKGGLSFQHLRFIEVLDPRYDIKKVQLCPRDPSILAVQATSNRGTEVFLMRLSQEDNSREIMQAFPNAVDFIFNEDTFLICEDQNIITIFVWNRDNQLVKLLAYKSPVFQLFNSFVLSTVNGETMLFYSLTGSSVIFKEALCN